MNKSDFLKERYLTIADYPNSNYVVGEIVHEHPVHKHRLLHPENYPHLFRKMDWWEKRERTDMPDYVGIKEIESDNVVIVKVWKWNYYNGELLGISYKIGGGTMINYLLPATEKEYNKYKQQ